MYHEGAIINAGAFAPVPIEGYVWVARDGALNVRDSTFGIAPPVALTYYEWAILESVMASINWDSAVAIDGGLALLNQPVVFTPHKRLVTLLGFAAKGEPLP